MDTLSGAAQEDSTTCHHTMLDCYGILPYRFFFAPGVGSKAFFRRTFVGAIPMVLDGALQLLSIEGISWF